MNCLKCGASVSPGAASCPACDAPVRIPPAAAYADLIKDRTTHFTGREWVFEWVKGTA